MFPQHIISVCINKPGVDIALAQVRSIASTGAGLVPNPCRSPGAETISGTFLDWRCPPASLLQDRPRGIRQARPSGSSASCRRLVPSSTARTRTWPQCILSLGRLNTTFRLFSLFTLVFKTTKKPNIHLAGISLKNPFVSQKHNCHETATNAAHMVHWNGGFMPSGSLRGHG